MKYKPRFVDSDEQIVELVKLCKPFYVIGSNDHEKPAIVALDEAEMRMAVIYFEEMYGFSPEVNIATPPTYH